MTRLVLATIIVAGTFSACETASAQHWCSHLWYSFSDGYHRANQWPEPYIEPDRAATMAPFDMMVANGWRKQNLLGAAHFDQETDQLTEAGKRKVFAILTQNPIQHRTVFVSRDMKSQVTDARMRSVQGFTGTLEEGKLADVQSTHIFFEGRPAEVVDATNVRFYESQPTPVLPAVSADSGN